MTANDVFNSTLESSHTFFRMRRLMIMGAMHDTLANAEPIVSFQNRLKTVLDEIRRESLVYYQSMLYQYAESLELDTSDPEIKDLIQQSKARHQQALTEQLVSLNREAVLWRKSRGLGDRSLFSGKAANKTGRKYDIEVLMSTNFLINYRKVTFSLHALKLRKNGLKNIEFTYAGHDFSVENENFAIDQLIDKMMKGAILHPYTSFNHHLV